MKFNGKNNNEKQQQKQEYNINIKKYMSNGSLVIIDSDMAFSNVKEEETITHTTKKELNDQIYTTNNNNNFLSLVRMSANHANKLRKEGITILVEYGFIYNNNKNNKK